LTIYVITLRELMALDKYEKLFLLFLPMTGVEETERKLAESLMNNRGHVRFPNNRQPKRDD